MKIICPRNPDHKRFSVTAHLTEEWIVDERGNFLDVYEGSSGEVTHRPDSDDCYTCIDCQDDAKVIK